MCTSQPSDQAFNLDFEKGIYQFRLAKVIFSCCTFDIRGQFKDGYCYPWVYRAHLEISVD